LTTTPRPRLTLDDPLTGPQQQDTGQSAPPRRPRRASSPRTAETTAETPRAEETTDKQPVVDVPASDEWRDWSGRNRVASFRLPDELLDELVDRAARLGLPIGQTVIAALTSLLDHDDTTLIGLADRAAQAIVRGKRRNRQQRAAGR
jgi:hypothetical protein